MKIGAVILAAGGSTRLGSPKQLLEYGGQTLVRRAVRAAWEAGCRPVVAVLGAASDRVEDALAGSDAWITINPAWELGMGLSVKFGVETLDIDGAGRADAALLMVCDQPLIGQCSLEKLCEAFRQAAEPDAAVIAAAYHGTVGVPAIFGRAHFPELCNLPHDSGAKPVLMRHRASVVEVPLPEAAIDIDTREQYERLTTSI